MIRDQAQIILLLLGIAGRVYAAVPADSLLPGSDVLKPEQGHSYWTLGCNAQLGSPKLLATK